MGALAIREKQLLYPASRVRVLPPGPVGVVFQSGGTFMYWLQQAAVRGLGFSYAVSSGNELDLDLADFINFLIDDENTKVITCMVEGVRRPEVFMAVAEKALRRESRSSWSSRAQRKGQGCREKPYGSAGWKRSRVRCAMRQDRHNPLPVA